MFPFFGMVSVFARRLGLTVLEAEDITVSPDPSVTTLKVQRNGDVLTREHADWTTQNILTEWIAQAYKTATIGDLYECKLTKISGPTPTSAPIDTWIAISEDRQWNVNRLTPGDSLFLGTLQVREIADPSNIVSASVSLHAKQTAF